MGGWGGKAVFVVAGTERGTGTEALTLTPLTLSVTLSVSLTELVESELTVVLGSAVMVAFEEP